MSIAIVVCCDGTPEDRPSIPLGQCRASFPTAAPLKWMAVGQAQKKGWSLDGERNLCPSCTGARARRKP